MNRFQLQKADKVESDALKESNISVRPHEASLRPKKDGIGNLTSEDVDLSEKKWKRLELAWLPKALEPALQLCRWALTSPTGLFAGLIIIE